jgi:hypothetical protein
VCWSQTGFFSTGSGCCAPSCPRALLEEERLTLEREISTLQVSTALGLPLGFLLNGDIHASHLGA